ncbi:MAG: hypothetical protein JSW73_05540 [Candidatus Woesearchaeota archaeon]|nr:MAG: hypothetical protein JSW73_05540 [Candidatus Woesearchaeota archaeon]
MSGYFNGKDEYFIQDEYKLIKEVIKSKDKELSEIMKAIKEVGIILDTALTVIEYLEGLPHVSGRKLKHSLKKIREYTEFLEEESKKAAVDEKHVLRFNKISYKLLERAKKDLEQNKIRL